MQIYSDDPLFVCDLFQSASADSANCSGFSQPPLAGPPAPALPARADCALALEAKADWTQGRMEHSRKTPVPEYYRKYLLAFFSPLKLTLSKFECCTTGFPTGQTSCAGLSAATDGLTAPAPPESLLKEIPNSSLFRASGNFGSRDFRASD